MRWAPAFLARVPAERASLRTMNWETMAEVGYKSPHVKVRADLDFYPRATRRRLATWPGKRPDMDAALSKTLAG